MLKTLLYWISGVRVTKRFIHNAKLFPLNTADIFHGCRIRVANFGTPQYITLTGKSTDSDDNVLKNLGSLGVQNLLLAVVKMNDTVVFRKTTLSPILNDGLRELGKLVPGMSDILIVQLPLLPALVSSTFEPTIPYEYTALKWFDPCPQPDERMEKIRNTYQLIVWLTMATVVVLISILWLGLANSRHSF